MRDGVFHKRMTTAFGVSVIALTGAPMAALAQGAPRPTPPPSREQVNPLLVTPVKPHKRVDSHNVADFAPCALDESKLTASITSVNFSGPGGAPLPDKIKAVLAKVGPISQGEAPLNQVCRIRDNANSALRQSGYIASAQIVAQDMSSGVLQLRVVTAHFSDIRVHGDPGPYRALMDERIKQLMALDPLNEMEAERILLLTGDVPGLDVKLSLRSAGKEAGAVIGDLNVATTPYRVQVNANSFGSETIGRASAYARVEVFGLTGHADVTYLGVSSTLDGKEQNVVQVGHVMGVGKKGDTIGANFVYAKSRPDLGGLNLQTDSTIANVEYYHPIIRTVSKDLLLYAGLDIIEQKTKVQGGTSETVLNLDKVRVAYARLAGALQGPGLQGGEGMSLRGSLEVRQGLNILGTSKSTDPRLSRRFADPTATVVRTTVDGVAGLGPIFTAVGSVRGQWSDRPLVNYEEFAAGNLTIGRGYDPGALTGDKALAWRAEIRALFARSQPVKGEAFAFYDNVHIWNHPSPAPGSVGPITPDTEANRTLASYGAGVRFILPGKWVGEVTYAKPLEKALSIDKAPPPPRIMFSITTQFPSSY